MNGPFPLLPQMINKVVDDDVYGVYLLAHPCEQGNSCGHGGEIVVYVGRGNVKERLVEHETAKDAKRFYFKSLDDDYEQGFREECRLFHHYGKRPHLDNERHPDVPDGSGMDRPKCSVPGCTGDAD